MQACACIYAGLCAHVCACVCVRRLTAPPPARSACARVRVRRVTDDKDRLLLNTLLEVCYCPQMVQVRGERAEDTALRHVAPHRVDITAAATRAGS